MLAPEQIAYVNARLIDPATNLDVAGAIVTLGGEIQAIGPNLFPEGVPEDFKMIDCAGHVLCPGLIDMRVFVGEPGAEHQETLATASQAAAAGGVTTIIVMPNTDPVIDDVSLVDFIKRRSRGTALVNVHPMAALTKGLKGEALTEMGLLREAGAVGFTDGRHSVTNSGLMRNALAYASNFDALVVHHAEDPTLVENGAMNEGEFAARLGLNGIPSAAETIMVHRDLALVELTGAKYHLSQVSCAAALKAVEKAKADGLNVTCAVSAHHLCLNENDVGDYRTFFKTDPPLRAENDRHAMVEGLARGTVDVVVSSHGQARLVGERKDLNVSEIKLAVASDIVTINAGGNAGGTIGPLGKSAVFDIPISAESDDLIALAGAFGFDSPLGGQVKMSAALDGTIGDLDLNGVSANLTSPFGRMALNGSVASLGSNAEYDLDVDASVVDIGAMDHLLELPLDDYSAIGAKGSARIQYTAGRTIITELRGTLAGDGIRNGRFSGEVPDITQLGASSLAIDVELVDIGRFARQLHINPSYADSVKLKASLVGSA